MWLGLSALGFLGVAIVSGSTLQVGTPTEGDVVEDSGPDMTEAFEMQSAGQMEQAAILYREALQEDPSSVVAHFNLGIIEMAEGDPDAAAAEYERVIALDPPHVPARFNLAMIRTELNNPEAAITLYRELLAIEPAHPEALLNLGVLLLQQGDAVEGSGLIDRALQLDPGLDTGALAG
jgi:tetratricopeptide (TPR) repeat protein